MFRKTCCVPVFKINYTSSTSKFMNTKRRDLSFRYICLEVKLKSLYHRELSHLEKFFAIEVKIALYKIKSAGKSHNAR